MNDGKCVIKNGNATCNCPDRYTGKVCQLGKFRSMYQLRFYVLINYFNYSNRSSIKYLIYIVLTFQIIEVSVIIIQFKEFCVSCDYQIKDIDNPKVKFVSIFEIYYNYGKKLYILRKHSETMGHAFFLSSCHGNGVNKNNICYFVEINLNCRQMRCIKISQQWKMQHKRAKGGMHMHRSIHW